MERMVLRKESVSRQLFLAYRTLIAINQLLVLHEISFQSEFRHWYFNTALKGC